MNYAGLSRVTGILFLVAAAPAFAEEPLRLDSRLEWHAPADGSAQAYSSVPLSPATRAGRRAALVSAADGAVLRHANPAAALSATATHSGTGGSTIVQYRQRVGDVEVYGARLSVLLGADLAPRVVSGGVTSQTPQGTFALEAQAAVQAAFAATDPSLSATTLRTAASKGAYERFEAASGGDVHATRPARAKRVWYPASDRLVPAYYAEVFAVRRGEERPLDRAFVISAEDGRVLATHPLVHDAQPFTYRVFATPQGQLYHDPYGFTTPHPTGLPDGWLPTTPAPMNLVTLVNAGISTGDPWLPDDATVTSGNNVNAFFNADALDPDGFCDGIFNPEPNAAEGDFNAPITGTRRFDYAYDVTNQANDYYQCVGPTAGTPIPTTSPQINAKIVQAFYATNWLHDKFYDLGYDEEAGNAQANNYGRGGIEGDPLYVHGSYYTTFANTPADGEAASLSLGANNSTVTRRDVSGFDLGVLAHEWTHTMFGRLIGVSFYVGQEGALNEGIADFVGMFLMVRAQDRNVVPGTPFGGAYAVGAYMNWGYSVRYDPLPPAGSPGYPDNTYYHGIRRFPMTVDLAKNPLTFKHMGVDNPLPQSANAYDWKLRSLQNSEVHTAGEVYTTALWQCARNILAGAPASQFEATHTRFLGWLVTGMKLMPVEPTFLDARDGLLFAIRADSEADYRRCRSGFAVRGMGAGAIAPDRRSYSLRGAVESYADAERALAIVGVKAEEVSNADNDGVLDRGEHGRLAITLRNTGFSPLTNAVVTVLPQFTRFVLPDGPIVAGIDLQPGESRVVHVALDVISSQPVLPIDIDVLAVAPTSGIFPLAAWKKTRVTANYDLVRDAYVESAGALPTFERDFTFEAIGFDHSCAGYICSAFEDAPEGIREMLDWQRATHRGEPAYKIGDAQMTIDAGISTVPFTVSATVPLKLILRHDYDFSRNQPGPTGPVVSEGSGDIEISVDGGEWEPAAAYVASGASQFTQSSNGWRTDTVTFGPGLAGHSVRLRFHAAIQYIFYPDDAYWALSRVEIQGATTPVFTSVHGDVH